MAIVGRDDRRVASKLRHVAARAEASLFLGGSACACACVAAKLPVLPQHPHRARGESKTSFANAVAFLAAEPVLECSIERRTT